jgi:hypothetical protein
LIPALAFLLLSPPEIGTGGATAPLSVELFKAACIDGSVTLRKSSKIDERRMAGGTRSALYRASRLAFYVNKSPPPRFKDLGDIYAVSGAPLTYLLPRMPTEASESSQPVCVVITKDKVYWPAQRAIRAWVKPTEVTPTEQPGLKVGDNSWAGIITDQTFEARLGKNSVAVFMHNGWTVMRALDHTGRPHPFEKIKVRKTQ